MSEKKSGSDPNDSALTKAADPAFQRGFAVDIPADDMPTASFKSDQDRASVVGGETSAIRDVF